MNILRTGLLMLTAAMASCMSGVESYSSPEGNTRMLLDAEEELTFTLIHKADTLLQKAPIGLMVNDRDCSKGVSAELLEQKEINESWEPVNGKQKEVHVRGTRYRWAVKDAEDGSLHYELEARISEKGFAYRYIFPGEAIRDSLKITAELTSLEFGEDYRYWAYNGERHNLGPVRRSEKKMSHVNMPAVLQLDDGPFVGVHEAAIMKQAPLSLKANAEQHSLHFNTHYSTQKEAFATSWRAFLFGESVGELVESDFLLGLNAAPQEDFSWVKPGKSLWDWRVAGYKAPDGFEYGLNTVSHKRMIDFAAENNIQYLLIDADWYGAEFSTESDPTTARSGINIEACMQHAKNKDIGLILYLNDVGAKKFGLERVLKKFSDWGAVGIKYGFMRGTAEQRVAQTRRVVELCAKYQLMVNFHDNPIAPSGDRRTWPNLVTKEFGHAQADARYSHYPETSVNQVLINQIAGPIDMTNGWFALNDAHEGRPKVFQELPGTVVGEVAKLITLYSGWMVLPDAPEAYLTKADLFDCIRQMPAQFDSFKILDAELDEYVSVARKAGDDWFVGSLSNRSERKLTLDLSFLEEGVEYEATIYEDAPESHFLNNKEAYVIRKENVNSESSLNIRMAPGGGHAMYLKKLD